VTSRYDVVIVGAANAALCAAHAARERVERVLVLEKAPRERAGGNTFFTAGAFRVAYGTLEQARPLLEGLTDEMAARVDLPPYREADFLADLVRMTEGRCDPALAGLLTGDSFETVRWMHGKGIRWELMFARQSFPVGDRFRFFGGLALGTVGGGKGLLAQHLEAARRAGIEIRYDSPAVGLLRDGRGVRGVVVEGPRGREEIAGGAVVLASGGFEADPRMRAQYLGPNWDIVKVRGSEANTGDGIKMALEAGAQAAGHWSGCHAVFWDAGAPPTGDWELTNQHSKLSYPLGLIVNREGRRFVDEGADFRNYTYAKYGAEILRQPGAIAYQLYDQKVLPLLRKDEYEIAGATRVEAASMRALAEKLGIGTALERTVEAYNAAVQPGAFNPADMDGKCTVGIEPPKSNWAQKLDQPPFVAYPVTVGITFTFGGLRIDTAARVLDGSNRPIPGLHAAGELVGGLFFHNYPGGSGLMAGAVFGRRAGETAARASKDQEPGLRRRSGGRT
jgi:tricarballylate dehydrogenase